MSNASVSLSAAAARALAHEYLHVDRRFAADLFAAADRHELLAEQPLRLDAMRPTARD
jgi:hypothetical protein